MCWENKAQNCYFRVLDLEKKKDVAIEVLNKKKSEVKVDDEELDEDIDEFLDWRQKKSF